MAYIGNDPKKNDSVDTAQIVDNAITNAKLADDAIDSADLADASVDLAHMSANSVDSDQYVDLSIDNAHVATGLDAVKLADGSVTNTELQYINTLSSNAQTQINAKLPLSGGAMTGAITTNSTFDGVDIATRDGILSSTTTTANAALPKAGGAMTGAITTNSTFDGVDIATRDGILTSTTTTANAALPKAGGAMTGAITTNSTFDGVDIATRDGILTSTTTTANAALPKAGGTMSGNIAMGGNNISGGGTITGTFVGGITGNVTGNTSGTAATVTTAAQPTITSVGTLTSFRSTGIDDNADALALTLDSSENATFAGDVIVTGGLTVNGTTTTINSATLSVDDKNIELGSVATPSDTTANLGGITLKGASDKTILWTNATDTWDFNQGIKVTSGNSTFAGTVDATHFDASTALQTGGTTRIDSSGVLNNITGTDSATRNAFDDYFALLAGATFTGGISATTGTFSGNVAVGNAASGGTAGKITYNAATAHSTEPYISGNSTHAGMDFVSLASGAKNFFNSAGNFEVEIGSTDALTIDTSRNATFAGNAVFNGEVLVNNTSSGNAKLYIKGGGTSTANSLYITDSAGADILYVKDNKSAKFYGTLETVGNATFAGDIILSHAKTLKWTTHGGSSGARSWAFVNGSPSDNYFYLKSSNADDNTLDVNAITFDNVGQPVFTNNNTTYNMQIGSATQSSYTDFVLQSDSGNAQIFKAGSGYSSWAGALSLNIYNSNGAIAFHPNAVDSALELDTSGNATFTGDVIVSQSGDGNAGDVAVYIKKGNSDSQGVIKFQRGSTLDWSIGYGSGQSGDPYYLSTGTEFGIWNGSTPTNVLKFVGTAATFAGSGQFGTTLYAEGNIQTSDNLIVSTSGQTDYAIDNNSGAFRVYRVGTGEALSIDTSLNSTFAGTITAQGTSHILKSMTSTTDPTNCINLQLQNTSDTDNNYNVLMFKDAQGNDASCVAGRHDDHSGNKGSIEFWCRNGGSMFKHLKLGNDGNATFTGNVELAQGSNANPQLAIYNAERRWEFFVHGSSNDQLNIKDGTADATRMSIFSDGNVCIGSRSSTGYKLDVRGSIYNEGTNAEIKTLDTGTSPFCRITGMSIKNGGSAIDNGNVLMRISADGYNGSWYYPFGKIEIAASGTINSSSSPGKMTFFTGNASNTTPSTALTLDSSQNATFSGGVWIAGAPGGGAAVANGGKAFGFVTANTSTAGTPKVSFAGGCSDGYYAVYIVTTGTRSNANAKVSVGIVTFTKGYGQTVTCSVVTLAGQTMGSTNNSSGGTIDFVVTGDGSSGGSGVPTASTCMQIGGNPNHGVTVMCHTT